MRGWVCADRDQPCGGKEQCRIKAGDPMFVVSLEGVEYPKVRCAACAWEPVDQQAYEASKQKLRDDGRDPNAPAAKRELTPLKAFAHKVPLPRVMPEDAA